MVSGTCQELFRPHSSLGYRPPASEAVLSAIDHTPDPSWDLASPIPRGGQFKKNV